MDQKPWFLNTWVIIRCLGATQSPASLQVFNLWRKGWKSRLLVHLFQKRKHCHFFPKKEEEFSKPLYWKICLTIKIKKSLGSKILTMFDRLSENFFFLVLQSLVKVKSLSRVQLFANLWTVAHQAPPLSMGFSRQEY